MDSVESRSGIHKNSAAQMRMAQAGLGNSEISSALSNIKYHSLGCSRENDLHERVWIIFLGLLLSLVFSDLYIYHYKNLESILATPGQSFGNKR